MFFTRLNEQLTKLSNKLSVYQRRRYSRRQLLFLNDHQLKDIGLSRADAKQEGTKPFWKV